MNNVKNIPASCFPLYKSKPSHIGKDLIHHFACREI